MQENLIAKLDAVEIQSGQMPTLEEHLKTAEYNYIKKILEIFKKDKNKTAKALGISAATLYRRLRDMPREEWHLPKFNVGKFTFKKRLCLAERLEIYKLEAEKNKANKPVKDVSAPVSVIPQDYEKIAAFDLRKDRVFYCFRGRGAVIIQEVNLLLNLVKYRKQGQTTMVSVNEFLENFGRMKSK